MSTTSKADRNAISGHVLRKVICATACAAFALPVAATAEDVNIAADTATGVNLDASVGSTARVFPGVTVDNAGTGIGATTQAWTLTNQGTVKGTNSISFTQGGAVTNASGAQINAGLSGIVLGTFNAGGAGTVDNFGAITATVEGVTLADGGTVTNHQGATVSTTGSGNAVSVGQGTSRVVINSGEIHADKTTGFSTGVLVQGGGATVTNNSTGIVTGGYNGIYASSSAFLTFTNDGSITAVRGPAVEARGGGTFTNTGTIQSGNDGMLVASSNASTIDNSGTIGSTGAGRAIAFSGSATHTLNLLTGSILTGNVQGGSGTDNLVLMGTGTESLSRFLSFETLSMQGANWSLTGTGTFTTSAAVSGGVLAVNGQLTSPAVTVNAGGTLGGSGAVIGNVTVNGNIAPGNSIGTLNITGSYVQATGSTYTPEVNTTIADLINVTGTATIQGGTAVNVVAAPGFYTLGKRYTILMASSGVTGTYTTLTDNAPFVDFLLAYDANNVYLDVLRSTAGFQQIAQTPNQRAAAGGTELLGSGNPIFDAALMLDTPGALHAFDLLSGEVHGSVRSTLLEDSRFIREAITERLRQSAGGPMSLFAPRLAALNFASGEDAAGAASIEDTALAYSSATRKREPRQIEHALAQASPPPAPAGGPKATVWGHVFGNWSRASGDGNAAGLSRTTGGFFTGIDTTLAGTAGDIWRVGLAGGHQHSSIDVSDRASSGGIDSNYVAAYGGIQRGPVGLRTGIAYGWHDIDTSRIVAIPGFADAAHASYDGRTTQVFGEVGYGLRHSGVALEPFAGLAYVNVRTGGFTEAGGAATLTGVGGNADTTFSTIGLRAAAPLSWFRMVDLIARGAAGWRRAFGTIAPEAQLAFSSGTAPFTVAGTPIARDAAALELGIDGRLAPNAVLAVAYTGQIASHASDHGISASYLQRF